MADLEDIIRKFGITTLECRPTIERAVTRASRIGGWMSEEELEWLAAAAGAQDTVVELGSWKGRSTKAMAMMTDGVVYAVDAWKRFYDSSEMDPSYEEAERRGWNAIFMDFLENMMEEFLSGKLCILRRDHRDPDLPQYLPKPVDMVFIDGDHTPDALSSDLTTAYYITRPSGLICGHDYGSGIPAFDKAVDSLVKNRKLVEHTSIWIAPTKV